MKTALTAYALAVSVLAATVVTVGQEQKPQEPPRLPAVEVIAPPPVSASSDVFIPRQDFELRPQGRPADLVRLVPGVIIGQHAGGGKAEQYFVRGFDADHGTDIALFVDGFPVNLRSHAHGQGYADLHFLIPETVRRIESFKGPYHVEYGDFATAGAINFVTLDTVDENLFEAAGGMFGTQRYLTLLSPTRERVKSLIAVEGYLSDGPFDRPQNLQRFNAFAKATVTAGENTRLSLWATHYRGAWHASGQIPTRAVRSGLIGRFGSIDNSEGGDSHRTVVNGDLLWQLSPTQLVKVHAYGQYYALDLFSNFTFFWNDPVNGDGIMQRDRRLMGGADAAYEHRLSPFKVPTTATAGLQYRVDAPRVILARQRDRTLLGRTQDVDIVEQSISPFVKVDASPLPWLTLVTGARADVVHYDVRDNLHGAGGRLTGNATRAIPGVKANLILGPWSGVELFATFGTGFHSNDARAVILDPNEKALAAAKGYEFGVKARPHRRFEVSATYWVLALDSELVFVGDEGTTEARGPSRRHGWEFATRVKVLDWLSFSADLTVSRARFDNGDEVPLAPRLTARAELVARIPGGLDASVGVRHIADRYASEDRQQTARGYTLVDATARYRLKGFGPISAIEPFVSVENLFDVDYREAQFFFTSRLRGEPATGVDDIHFTPGNPRTVLGGIAVRF